jgi:hypothetical protein
MKQKGAEAYASEGVSKKARLAVGGLLATSLFSLVGCGSGQKAAVPSATAREIKPESDRPVVLRPGDNMGAMHYATFKTGQNTSSTWEAHAGKDLVDVGIVYSRILSATTQQDILSKDPNAQTMWLVSSKNNTFYLGTVTFDPSTRTVLDVMRATDEQMPTGRAESDQEGDAFYTSIFTVNPGHTVTIQFDMESTSGTLKA